MKCANPFFHPGYEVYFPCGCCLACRAQKAMEWSLRLSLEEVYHQDTAFVTLTYAPEHLPAYGSLSPTDLQAFLKRLRRKLDYRIRFYACGEYGDKFGRAHYHLIIFGLKYVDAPKVYEAWKKGRVEVEKTMSEKAFKYVAGYVNKKIGRQKEWLEKYPNLKPMFQRCSLGLGLRFVLEKVPHYTSTLIVGGKHRYIGRYLRNKLAEKFGILEKVKEEGLKIAIAQTELVLSLFYWQSSEQHISAAEFQKKHFGVGAYMGFVYQKVYGAAIEAFEKACKLRQSAYRRGVYTNDITATSQRIRRVFT